MTHPAPALRIAVLVKQIPKFEEMRLGPDGRLVRAGLELEMNAYCRRAVAKAVELVAELGGSCTVVTLGPPPAVDVLREAIAWAEARGVRMRGLHLCDPAHAGSDTLATARALAAVLRLEGSFDLVLVGRNSVDADTGQVGPQVAALLDLPFASGVREIAVHGGEGSVAAEVRCEHDDGWVQARVALPAVLSTAERLTAPCKVDAVGREGVAHGRIRRLTAAELGPGPWGEAASPTRVGATRVHEIVREKRMLVGTAAEQVAEAVALLRERGALDPDAAASDVGAVPPSGGGSARLGVVVEPGRSHLTREMLGAAAGLAVELGGTVTAIGPQVTDAWTLASWGADAVTRLTGSSIEEDIAAGVAAWAAANDASVLLVPSTAWGREVAARVAVDRGAGLVGDAMGLAVADGRLVAWKPAFGGQLVAAITSATSLQMATVRAGALPRLRERAGRAPVTSVALAPRGRVTVRHRERDDDIDVLAEARMVIGVGAGLPPGDHELLQPLVSVLGAELAATRKVTDKGWLPRARQVGITGRSIAPHLYVAVGISGKFNHAVGIRRAGTVVAINSDPAAAIFGFADIGLVGDWRDIVSALSAALTG